MSDVLRAAPARSRGSVTGSMQVRRFETGDEAAWDGFVLNSASGTFFHLSGWKTVIECVLGHRPQYLLAERDGVVTGVFPLCWVRSRLFGDCRVSVPLAVYGGICADDREYH